MMKYLSNSVDWDEVHAVGFDIDGTLYDEMEFISGVYRPISQIIADACGVGKEEVYDRILARWMEKGSSYDRIFEEVLLDHGLSLSSRTKVIDKCLSEYRSFNPDLSLSSRVRFLLRVLSSAYTLFLVTDGTSRLQRAKSESLGLERWFSESNSIFTGEYGEGYAKPDTRSLSDIEIPAVTSAPDKVVFFGDRQCDREFANHAGFHFLSVLQFEVQHVTC
jgi:FMN phosphatase YigB (HAD superfamily)